MEFTWIITAVLGLLLIYLLYVLANRNMNYWKKRGVPTAKSYPLFGNMLDVFLGKKTIVDIVDDVYKLCEGKKYMGYMMLQTPILLVRDLELINQVLVKDFSHFEDRTVPLDDEADLMNLGLQNLTGERWRVLRHKLTPSFTSGKMKIMFNQIKECGDEAVLYLKSKVDNDIDSRDFIFKFIINVIGTISFGIKVDALNEEKEKENQFYQNSKRLFKPNIWLQLKFLLFMAFPKIKDTFRIKVVDEEMNQFFHNLAQDLIKYREKDGAVKRNDFLQQMLDQKKRESLLLTNTNIDESSNKLSEDTDEPEDLELLEHLKSVKYDKNSVVFTDQIIAAQAFLFISGGSETVSAVLSFALHYLAENRDVQTRLQEEIDTVLENNKFTYDSIKKMPYMQQVLYEVLRLRPPGGMLMRLCVEDYKLPGTDLVIEKGRFVHIPVQAMHYDPQYFSDPLKFNPDRFEDMDAIPKGVFFPFGGGPRICIAMRLAMLEMKIFLTTILASYNVILSKKTKLPLKLNKKSFLQYVVGGLWVRFEPRKKTV